MTADDVRDIVAAERARLQRDLDAATTHVAFCDIKLEMARKAMNDAKAALAAFDAAHQESHP